MKRLRVSPSMVVAIIALIVALAGTGYAASKLNGSSIKKNSVPGNRIEKNSLGGKQIGENKLGEVPSAAQADQAAFAANAANATNAADADSVDGLTVLKFNYRRDTGVPPETILDLAGLKIEASCGPTDFPGAIATTTKQNSSLYGVADYPPGLDYDSFDYEGGAFDTDVEVDLDDEFDGLGDPRIASLVYEAPDGSVVTVSFAADANGTSECVITGTAVGG